MNIELDINKVDEVKPETTVNQILDAVSTKTKVVIDFGNSDKFMFYAYEIADNQELISNIGDKPAVLRVEKDMLIISLK